MKECLLQMRLNVFLVLILLFLAVPLIAQSPDETTGEMIEADTVMMEPQEPPPIPAELDEIKDSRNDHGHSIDLTWTPTAVDDGTGTKIVGYQIWRGEEKDGEMVYTMRAQVPGGVSKYTDRGGKKGERDPMPNGQDYWYKIKTIAVGDVSSESAELGPFQAVGQWYHTGKTPVAVAVIVFFGFTVYFIIGARKGKKLYVRPIAGISAVDEAIGRATEMGKPILYVLGIGTAAEIATICSFTILSRVAKKVAEHQTQLTVPCKDPIVMTVAQEIVKNAYVEAGRPDSYDEDIVFFVTQDQFAYVAAVNGQMLRDKPASNFYLGYFAAESLLLAETGSLAGSIQIAGTDQVAQLPFFIVACDYTLIGEELYAGSAYLSQEPLLLGSLKAEDWGKAVFIVLALVGVVAATVGWQQFIDWVSVTL
jgi:Domain of unknown function (DUF6754)